MTNRLACVGMSKSVVCKFVMNQTWGFPIFTKKGNTKYRRPVSGWQNRIRGLRAVTQRSRWTRLTFRWSQWTGLVQYSRTLRAQGNHLVAPKEIPRKAAHIRRAQWEQWVGRAIWMSECRGAYVIKVKSWYRKKKDLLISQCICSECQLVFHFHHCFVWGVPVLQYFVGILARSTCMTGRRICPA